MRIYRGFERLIAAVCIAIFAFIGVCAYIRLIILDGNSPLGPVFQVILGLFFCAVLLYLIFRAFRMIESGSELLQKRLALIFFIIMAAVFLVLLLSFRVRPITDSFDDIDVAWYLTDHAAVDADNAYAHIMGIYGNNYLLIILLSWLFKVFRAVGITQVTAVLSILFAGNVAAIICGILFTWLTMKEVSGIKAANKVLLLCILNPVYYGLAFWVYSCTLSVPVMMAIIYVAVRIYKTGSVRTEIILSIVEGLLIILGFEIRPTAVFPVIAIAVCTIELIIKHRFLQKALRPGIIILITGAIAFAGVRGLKTSRFSEVMPNNYPVSYWILLGSYGNGDLSTQDYANESVAGFSNEDKMSGCLKLAGECYKQNGIAGTVKLWAKKTATTWADGYSAIYDRMNSGETESSLYEWIAGNKNYLYQLYSLAFRLITMFGLILMCIRILREKHTDSVLFMLLLTVFGGIVFYMIWEAKSVYSAPFIPVMLMLAGSGYSGIEDSFGEILSDKRMGLIAGGVTVVMCVAAAVISVNQQGLEYYRISALNNTRRNTWIDDRNRDIVQTFEVQKPFNRIVFKSGADDENVSDYELTITGSDGTVRLSRTVNAADVADGKLVMDFDEISGGAPYTLSIHKVDNGKNSLWFYSKNSYFLDSYRGQLAVGEEPYIADLMMDVMFEAD